VEKPSLPPPSELSLIEHAEASRLHPNEALAFLAKHEEIYPRGALAQEREVLAIELLLKAGRLSQAETRAERFEDAYPSSAHLPHLRALLTRASAK
jgi:outer membrane protein assembly factor BamD (BamD/ComL family)